MNLELLKAGFSAVALGVEQRLRYYEALDAAHTAGDHREFPTLIAECVEAAFEPYWQARWESGWNLDRPDYPPSPDFQGFKIWRFPAKAVKMIFSTMPTARLHDSE